MSVLLFRVTRDGHEGPEKSAVPDVDECHGDPGVDAEDFDAGKGRQDAGHEAQEIGDARHRDRDGGIAHRPGKLKKEVVERLKCRTSEVRLGIRFPLRPG